MLKRCPDEECVDERGDYLLNFWYHEIQRTFVDRITKPSDVELFQQIFKQHIQKVKKKGKIFADTIKKNSSKEI